MELSKKNLFLVLTLLGAFTTNVMADQLLDETEEVLNSEEIAIDGTFQQKPQKTAADHMADRRRRIEEKNEEMVRKRIESIRMNEERELAKKLKGAFANGLQEPEQEHKDEVKEVKSAPEKEEPTQVTKIYVPVPIKPAQPSYKEFSAGINVGGQEIKGTRDDFQTSLSGSVDLDYHLTSQFSLGVQIGMSKMDITDTACVSSYSCNINGFNPYWTNYNSFYPKGREISYRNLSFGFGGKLSFGNSSRFRPYIGVMGAYNRLNMVYTQSSENHYQNYYYGGEEFSANYMSVTGTLGALFAVTPNFGLSADIRYGRAVSDLMSISEPTFPDYQTRDDQERLEGLAERIVDADFISANLGLVVSF
ncbi:MAG: porin family protein [Halobacteriovoraceae bacterium]|nr:porin family protein [Halobacteriovoraceae bacterium]